MPLLSRNPFHSNHHHHHHNDSQRSSSPAPVDDRNHEDSHINGNNQSQPQEHNSENTPPPPRLKSSKSFLHFIHRGHSNDSLRSDMSIDSHAGTTIHTNRNNSQTNLNNTSSPVNQFNSISSTSPSNNHHHSGKSQTRHNVSDHSSHTSSKPTHSMAELKRFFRPSLPKRKSSNLSPKDNNKPSTSTISMSPYTKRGLSEKGRDNTNDTSHSQSAIPPASDSTLSLSNKLNIYHDDSILAQKYGKLGKLLGSGAGGSVKVLIRPSDGATFAVKEFRPRKPNELVKAYAKKCTAEFLIGSTLNHPNIIETLDIFSDAKQDKYFEVMEYCPVDFFAVVMTGKMSRGEINCCIKQISKGVQYIHSKGLAHRDLKLDNCVMTADGIIKLIDFGSAVVFKYPFENKITLAHGIVGSDPYLAPEVITSTKSYDPQFVDVWSIGIIFCCLMLKRFPWKAPRQDSDENFKYFCMEDDMEHDYVASAKHNEMIIHERLKKKHEKENMLKRQKERKEAAKEGRIEEYLKKHPDEVERSKSSNSEQQAKPAEESDGNNTVEQSEVPCKDEVNKSKLAKASEKDDEKSTNNEKENTKSATTYAQQKPRHHKGVIHGPYRLLRLLPHASRPILSKMLMVDPSKRATMDDIFEDEWFQNIQCCTLDAKKTFVPAQGHHHTLVDEKDAHLESYKK